MTFNQTDGLELFYDGLSVDTESDTSDNNDNTIAETRIGSDPLSGLREFFGNITDVRLYTRGLSPAEVWQIFDPRTRWELYGTNRIAYI